VRTRPHVASLALLLVLTGCSPPAAPPEPRPLRMKVEPAFRPRLPRANPLPPAPRPEPSKNAVVGDKLDGIERQLIELRDRLE
jgi:hypothetical protein